MKENGVGLAVVAGIIGFGAWLGHDIIPLGVFALTLLIGIAVIFFTVRRD